MGTPNFLWRIIEDEVSYKFISKTDNDVYSILHYPVGFENTKGGFFVKFNGRTKSRLLNTIDDSIDFAKKHYSIDKGKWLYIFHEEEFSCEEKILRFNSFIDGIIFEKEFFSIIDNHNTSSIVNGLKLAENHKDPFFAIEIYDGDNGSGVVIFSALNVGDSIEKSIYYRFSSRRNAYDAFCYYKDLWEELGGVDVLRI